MTRAMDRDFQETGKCFAPYVALTGERSIFAGESFAFTRHRNVVPTLAVGLDGQVALDGETAAQPLIILPANTEARLETGGRIALVFADPMRDDVGYVDLRRIDLPSLRRDLMQGPKAGAAAFVDAVFETLGVAEREPPRPDVAAVVDALAREPDALQSLDAAAALTELSADRLRKVFVETVGTTFTRYRQWRRMGAVIRAVADGASLTEAAYASGFANSAHLSSAFREMFGLSPSDLVSTRARYVLDPL